MADFAIGAAFHKAHRTLVRAVPLTPPNRLFATRDSAGFVTLPTLPPGQGYIEMQGVTSASFQVDDSDQDFRLMGDDGWTDSVTTGARVRSSMRSYFIKNIEIPGGSTVPQFRGDYSEDFALVERTRYDKEFEIYFELLKEMGRLNGTSGDYIYDYAGFNGVIRNFNDGGQAEGLTEISFDVMSRGRPVFGRYNAGSSPLTIGQIQSSLLFLVAGTRQAAVVPADNATSVVVSNDLTVTYTSNGTAALAQLALGDSSGSGFRLEVASTGVQVPAVVSLGGAGTNVVTINPAADLAAATIYRLRVADGAITQSVDSSGTASPSGSRRPLQGLTTTFRTA
jgi:hypothetical protein